MIAVWIILGILALILIWGIGTYNRLIGLKERVRKAWADIDIQLKRRFDMIPNLVETVKGYAKHESETLTKVTQLRAKYNETESIKEKAEITNETTKLLNDFLVSVEAYPELKANENFSQLQSEIKNTEDKISYSRQFYNDITARYNISIKTVPTSIIAGMFGFTPEELFQIENPQERENVKVEF